MPTFSRTVTVDAPVDRTFELATDVTRAPDWVPGVLRCELLNGTDVRPGTRFRETRKIGKREATAVIEVCEHEAPRVHAASAKALGVTCLYRFTFTPDGDRTRVDLFAQATGKSFGKLFAGMMLKMMEKVDGEMLARMKEFVERHAATGSP